MNPQQPTSKGGPAFPSPLHPGMTLRDAFAIVVLRELIAASAILKTPGISVETTAAASYAMADAMLVERMKKRDDEPPPGPKLAA
jgi:hypothetical protein